MGVTLVIVELNEKGISRWIRVILPQDEAVAVRPHGVSHQVVLEKIPIPFIPLLGYDALLHFFNERTEKSLTGTF